MRKFGRGVFHDASVKGLLRVIIRGCRVIKEALQVGVDHGLEQILAKLVDKKRNQNAGRRGEGGGRGEICENQNTFITYIVTHGHKISSIKLLYFESATLYTNSHLATCISPLFGYSIQIGGHGAHSQ